MSDRKFVFTVVVTNPLDDKSFWLRTFEDLGNAENFAADITDADGSSAVVVQNPYFSTYLEQR